MNSGIATIIRSVVVPRTRSGSRQNNMMIALKRYCKVPWGSWSDLFATLMITKWKRNYAFQGSQKALKSGKRSQWTWGETKLLSSNHSLLQRSSWSSGMSVGGPALEHIWDVSTDCFIAKIYSDVSGVILCSQVLTERRSWITNSSSWSNCKWLTPHPESRCFHSIVFETKQGYFLHQLNFNWIGLWVTQMHEKLCKYSTILIQLLPTLSPICTSCSLAFFVDLIDIGSMIIRQQSLIKGVQLDLPLHGLQFPSRILKKPSYSTLRTPSHLVWEYPRWQRHPINQK